MATVTTGQSPAARSTFVTAVAWVFIVLGGFATLISALQNIMIAVMFSTGGMEKAFDQANCCGRLPWYAEAMFRNFHFVFLAFLLLSVAMLTASIGLLMRRNWARLVFVTMLGFGIAWNIAGVALSVVFAYWTKSMPGGGYRADADQFEVMALVIVGVNVLMAAGFTVLFGWIIKRLFSPEIRREFS